MKKYFIILMHSLMRSTHLQMLVDFFLRFLIIISQLIDVLLEVHPCNVLILILNKILGWVWKNNMTSTPVASPASTLSSSNYPSQISSANNRIREIELEELRIHSNYIHECLSAILHTILYLRAPNHNFQTSVRTLHFCSFESDF